MALRILRAIVPVLMTLPVAAGGIDIEKIKLKGQQHIKDLKYFQDSGLIVARNTAIEMQVEAFEKSLTAYREAKTVDRNAALKGARAAYERFQGEFKAIAEIFRGHVEKYQSGYNEKSNEPYESTTVKEKILAVAEVGKQDETRASSAFANRNYPYSAHLYLRSLKAYYQAFELRKWQQLVKMAPAMTKPGRPKKKAAGQGVGGTSGGVPAPG